MQTEKVPLGKPPVLLLSKDAVLLFLATCSNKKDKKYCIPNHSTLKIVWQRCVVHSFMLFGLILPTVLCSMEKVDCERFVTTFSIEPFSDVEKWQGMCGVNCKS